LRQGEVTLARIPELNTSYTSSLRAFTGRLHEPLAHTSQERQRQGML